MKTAIIIILLTLQLNAQSQIKIDNPVGKFVFNELKISDSVKENDIFFMKLFKFDPENDCNQSKSLKIIYQDTISKCFDFIKDLDQQKSRKVFHLLNSNSTFGAENYPCFNTEYALIIYDKNTCIVGTIRISLECNKVLMSYYSSSFDYFNKLKFSPIGLSQKSRKQIIKICNLKE